jgi:osmoprotectant transport system permease protein
VTGRHIFSASLPICFVLIICDCAGSVCRADEPTAVRIGAKSFTESVVLAEVLARLAESAGANAETITLGGTPVVWQALLAGEIDAYVEYTGTLREEILSQQVNAASNDLNELAEALVEKGVLMSRPLGFNNTYALAVSRQWAQDHPSVTTISDLREHPQLRYGFGNEFMDRGDGWPRLAATYNLPFENARGLDHDLAYVGLESGTIDVMDVYTTDAEIEAYRLRVLRDDRGFFPNYEAVILYRSDFAQRAAPVVAAFGRLEGAIDETMMIALNAEAKLQQRPEPLIAADFVRAQFGIDASAVVDSRWQRMWRYTREHLVLVGISVSLAILLAIPLGIAAAKRERFGQVVLALVGILQTIPSLVMFVVLIPLLGVGPKPAICALFFYSLLPIVRNTHAGLTGIPQSLQESALALGLPPAARMRLIELPLAARSILAGIKTAAVINVGTATLGGFVSAGGYGEPIFRGIRLARNDLLLEGAIPAALMALAAQGVFDLLERRVAPEYQARP